MKKQQIILWVLLAFSCITCWSQEYTIGGTVEDVNSQEKLIGVNIFISELNKGVTTNSYGYFMFNVPAGTYEISFSFIGYETLIKKVRVEKNLNNITQLTPALEVLDEVIIAKNKQQVTIEGTEMSTNTLQGATIKKIPAVLGEADVIKAITLLPGVSTANETASGFNVRGGSSDQNLILMDEATLFSSSHLFGFFSIFNPDIVKEIKLYKGGIPARYGGRLSSVLDIRQREGNKREFHGEGGVGTITSRLLLEGPIVKNKTSFLVAGRTSYVHLFLPLLDINNSASYYDFNLIVNHHINDKNNFYLSSYSGADNFKLDGVLSNQYGNRFTNFRWNHVFSNNLFSNTSLIYADYFYKLDLDVVGFSWKSDVTYLNFKYDFEHYLKDALQLKYGLNLINYDFNPGRIESLNDNEQFVSEQFTKKKALEGALYVEADIDISEKIKINTGLRFSSFLRFGEPSISIYENNQAVFFDENTRVYKEANAIGEFTIDKKKVWKDFYNLEPRIAIAYEFNEANSIKASYQRTVQYLHLISNTLTPLPLDIWTPSGGFIDPEKSDLWALGYFKSIADGEYTLSTELYYKEIDNKINFFDGADIIGNKNIERTLLFGEGRAYGLEFLLQKNYGKFQGWLAYTYSRSEELIPGRTATETGINNGNWYPSNFDKTHDISIVGNYAFNKKWKLNTAFNFQTGTPATFATGAYNLSSLDINVPVFGERNANRLPNFHRLDVSMNYTPKPNSKKRWKSEWVFSIYNLYNRKNANSINFERNFETNRNEAVRLSIFGIIPAVSYNFKF